MKEKPKRYSPSMQLRTEPGQYRQGGDPQAPEKERGDLHNPPEKQAGRSGNDGESVSLPPRDMEPKERVD
jgi:hypothetical protein